MTRPQSLTSHIKKKTHKQSSLFAQAKRATTTILSANQSNQINGIISDEYRPFNRVLSIKNCIIEAFVYSIRIRNKKWIEKGKHQIRLRKRIVEIRMTDRDMKERYVRHKSQM